jgi:hypothetical protein
MQEHSDAQRRSDNTARKKYKQTQHCMARHSIATLTVCMCYTVHHRDLSDLNWVVYEVQKHDPADRGEGKSAILDSVATTRTAIGSKHVSPYRGFAPSHTTGNEITGLRYEIVMGLRQFVAYQITIVETVRTSALQHP